MKKLLAFILWLPVCAFAQVPPPSPASVQDVIDGTATYKFISPASLAGAGITGGGGGTYVSNQLELSFTVDVWRTNNTSQIWDVSSSVTLSPGGGNAIMQWEVDTNLNGTADWDTMRSAVNGGTTVNHVQMGSLVLPGWAFRYFNNSSGGSAAPETGTGSIYYYSTNSSTSYAVNAGTATTASYVTGTLTNNTTGNAAGATNLAATYFWSTNTTEDKTRIFVTGTVTPATARGEYRLAWTNSTGFEAVWTNTVGTNLIWLNSTNEPSQASFRLTDGTNTSNWLISELQYNDHASEGSVLFWENPHELTDTAYFNGSATFTWGTNYVSTNFIRNLGNGLTTILPQYVPTNSLVVSLNGDDNLANRTNGWPFKTLWAANNIATNGDTIYVEPGYHYTYGIHMRRGVRIVGAGRGTIVNPLYDDDLNHATFFQSQLISIWDNCTVENLVITNGCIGFTQHEGTILGATNGLAKDLWIYPAYLPVVYPQILQPNYFGYGVAFTRLGTKNRCEKVKVYTGAVGFAFQSSLNVGIVSEFDLVDCEVIASPEFTGSTNYWLRTSMMGFNSTNIGGMIPIAFNLGDTGVAFNKSPTTLNIIGGKYASVNGGTNLAAYVGGETNTSRNSGIWLARGNTNQIRINFLNNPQFGHGNTNTGAASYFILNETTNNNITFTGTVTEKRFANGDRNSAGTNTLHNFTTIISGDGSGLTNTVNFAQLVGQTLSVAYGGGSPTIITNYGTAQAVGRFSVGPAIIGSITNLDVGWHRVAFTGGVGWATTPCDFVLYTNGVASHIGVLDMLALGADNASTVSFEGCVYLPANTRSDIRFEGDQPVGNSYIFTVEKK